MSLIGKLLGTLVKKGRMTLITADGKRESFGPDADAKPITIRFTDRKLAFEIVRNPRLAFGEAYMDGRLIVEEGSILDLLELIVGANRWEFGGRGRKLMSKGRMSEVAALFRRNPAAKSKKNVAHHYDLSDDLYDLFLDPDRQYSCAYYTDPANSLEEAQADKKAHIAAKLDLKPGQRVLDIGCGWGGMALYLNRVAGVDVLGITLSKEQLKVARERAEAAGVADHVKFELIDYRSLTGSFDRIVSVGMFEHVGAAHYDEFFATCHRLLAQDGVMLLHTIGKLGSAGSPDPFTNKWIFPGYHLPSLSQMNASSEKVRLIASDTEMLRVHYAYTLRAWLERCDARRADIVAMYDERFYRMWEFYLAGGIVMFENGSACNFQVQYIRDRYALPITRDYMAEAEARYRASELAR
ncbi:cyclopropane-fatty-acyl-phospholipid synthase family protein [Sphingomonas sp. RB1R13]|uniref:cyclopropane-fatty-acyl-phospholipid synthase family protein n=1 Tax=Sphingomonas sp. RB1R13 TaxID=3096159 RepID=UPI002FCA3BC3